MMLSWNRKACAGKIRGGFLRYGFSVSPIIWEAACFVNASRGILYRKPVAICPAVYYDTGENNAR